MIFFLDHHYAVNVIMISPFLSLSMIFFLYVTVLSQERDYVMHSLLVQIEKKTIKMLE